MHTIMPRRKDIIKTKIVQVTVDLGTRYQAGEPSYRAAAPI